jgi:hypothetical protein
MLHFFRLLVLLSLVSTAFAESTEPPSASSSGGLTDAELRASPVEVSLPSPPTGAATSAKQDTGNNSLSSIDTKLSSQSTATKQDTGNTSLSSIDTKLSSQATAANQATQTTRLNQLTTPSDKQNTISGNNTATGTASTATTLISVDTLGYASGYLTISLASGTAGPAAQFFLVFERSNNNSYWESAPVVYDASDSFSGSANITNKNDTLFDSGDFTGPYQYRVPFTFRYFRVRCTTVNDIGTAVIRATLDYHAIPLAVPVQNTQTQLLNEYGNQILHAGPSEQSTSISVSIASDQPPIDVSLDTSALATAAKQDTGNTSLSTINTKIPSQGQAAMASSVPVAIASNQSAVPVSGTFWQATQPVSGTFWQATQPVSGTFWQATQPVSAAALPLPTNAATDASVTGLQVAQASTTSGQSGPLVQGAVTSSAPSYTTAKTNPLSLTTAGALRVDASATTQPVSGTFWQTTQPVSGTFWQTTQPVSLATLPALVAGTAAIGKLAANDGVDIGDVTINNSTLAATQSGNWSVRLNDGSGTSIGSGVSGTGLSVVNTQTQTYFASALAVASGASKDYINLSNASGSGKVIRIMRIFASVDAQGAVTGLQTGWTVSRFTTVGSSCTSITIVPADTTNAAVPAQVTANTACTSDPGGTVTSLFKTSISADETQNGTINVYEFRDNGGQPITLREAEGITLNSGGTAPAGVVSVSIEFTM